MKKHFSALVVVTVLALLGATSQAKPVGPSAKAAAKLKTNPRTNWLAHYLPNDRYKIAGNIWKFVSTNLDTYYHLPNSPNMMRQPNDNVIGFASAADAEEAGYKPDPSDGTRSTVQNQIQSNAMAAEDEAVANGRGGSGLGGVKSLGIVALADGVSTMTIPYGWQRIASQKGKTDQEASVDLIVHPGSKNIAIVASMHLPNIDVGRELSSGNVVNNIKQFSALTGSGKISNGPANNIDDWVTRAKIVRTRWGGLTGIAITPPPEMRNSGTTASNMIMVGRGNKAYIFFMVGEGKAPSNTLALIKSFKAR